MTSASCLHFSALLHYNGVRASELALTGCLEQVAEFFKWKRIPIFRNDSAHCAVHRHDRLTIMGQTCISGLYVATHNSVHGILRGESDGEAKTAIPTTSRVQCGTSCGVSIPVRTGQIFPNSTGERKELLWRGTGPAGEELTIFRGETREGAMKRLVQTKVVSPDGERDAAVVLRHGIIEMLLHRRTAMLDSLRPFVHRSQVFGEPVDQSRVAHSPLAPATHHQQVVMPLSSTGTEVKMVWHVRENQVRREDASESGDERSCLETDEPGVGEDEAAAARFLWEHQHPTPAVCSKRNALVYMHDRAYWGFAANVHFMTVAFNYALAFNRTFLSMESDHWNYGGRDCRYGWQCYFHPLSSCSERDVWEPYTVPIRLDHWWDHRGYLYRIDTHEARSLYYGNVDGPWQEVIGNRRGPHGGPVRQWIPEQFRHRGLLWWRAQLTRYLVRPKAWVLGYIDQRRAALGLPVTPVGALSVVGLHVRRGDKSYDQYQGSFFGSIDSYIAKAHALNPLATTVFISTDDPAVIEGIPVTAHRHNLTVIYDDLEPRFNGTHIYAPPGISLARWPAFPGNDPNVNTTLYALETIKSVWLLAFACEDFVGTVTSSMSRLIYQVCAQLSLAAVLVQQRALVCS